MHTYKSCPRVFIAYFIKFKMLSVVRYTPLFCTTKKEIFSIKQYHNAFLLTQCISISELLNLKKMCFRINEIEYLGVGVLGQRKCTTSNLLEVNPVVHKNYCRDLQIHLQSTRVLVALHLWAFSIFLSIASLARTVMHFNIYFKLYQYFSASLKYLIFNIVRNRNFHQ